MLTEDGPKMLEFNCRLGDPEAQVLLPLLKTPLEDVALAVASGNLDDVGQIEWSDEAVVGVVMAAESYPGGQAFSRPVHGLSDVDEGAFVFHAGTTLRGARAISPLEGQMAQPVFRTLFGRRLRTTASLRTDFLSPDITASGGRILTVVGRGPTIREAREAAYRNVERIRIEGAHYRKDIGEREE